MPCVYVQSRSDTCLSNPIDCSSARTTTFCLRYAGCLHIGHVYLNFPKASPDLRLGGAAGKV